MATTTTTMKETMILMMMKIIISQQTTLSKDNDSYDGHDNDKDVSAPALDFACNGHNNNMAITMI